MFTKQQPLKNTSLTTQEQNQNLGLNKNAKTRITIKYDIGFGNNLYIRGKGANLNWEKGHPLKNIKRDEWVWETDAPFSTAEFKILINDKHFEIGQNHIIHSGNMIQYTPRF